MSNPNKIYYNSLNKIWQYIKNVLNYSILYNGINPKLIGYINSNWGNNYIIRKLINNYLFLFNNGPIL